MRSLRSAALAIAAATCGSSAGAAPAGDPPSVVGAPYLVDGTVYTPADKAFDDVGYASFDAASGPGVSAAHRTLPLPSYVEITALDTGRTILARVERQGPLDGKALIALSPAGFAQLGADPARPLAVRVRRVNPQEFERSLLRTGQRAAERLATPAPLLKVLRKNLADKSASMPEPARTVATSSPPGPVRSPKPVAVNTEASSAKGASFSVQVATFANRANAEATAKRVGGVVRASGKLLRVQIGPFTQRAEATAALARARKAGFTDARISASAEK